MKKRVFKLVLDDCEIESLILCLKRFSQDKPLDPKDPMDSELDGILFGIYEKTKRLIK